MQRPNFYPRPPRGGRLADFWHPVFPCEISIHALREEGDGDPSPHRQGAEHFYPRPPRGGRRGGRALEVLRRKFLSTPSARRATTYECFKRRIKPFLSTPSARRATQDQPEQDKPPQISIHALREEGDTSYRHCRRSGFRFLSTPSARRATYWTFTHIDTRKISIHALREEGDAMRALSGSSYF